MVLLISYFTKCAKCVALSFIIGSSCVVIDVPMYSFLCPMRGKVIIIVFSIYYKMPSYFKKNMS